MFGYRNVNESASLLELAVKTYVTEFKHFLNFLGYLYLQFVIRILFLLYSVSSHLVCNRNVFENSPFLISAEEARTAEGMWVLYLLKILVFSVRKFRRLHLETSKHLGPSIGMISDSYITKTLLHVVKKSMISKKPLLQLERNTR